MYLCGAGMQQKCNTGHLSCTQKKPPRSRSSGPGGQHNMIDQRLSAQEGVINRNTRHPVVRGSMHDNKVTQQLPKPGYRLLLSILQPSSCLLLQLLLPALLYLLIVLLLVWCGHCRLQHAGDA